MRNADPLPLPAGKHDSSCTNNAVVSMLQRKDEFVDISQLGCLHDFFIGGIFAPITDILPNRPIENIYLLLNNTNVFLQITQQQVTDIDPINSNLSRANIIESGNQGSDSRFSDTGRSGKGHSLTTLNPKGDILQHIVRRILVMERDLIEDNFSGRIGQGNGILCLLHRGLDFHHIHKANKAGFAFFE